MSLCISGLITIKGCSFYQTKDNAWIGGPQYKSGDDYKDYLYIDKKLNKDMDELAEELAELLSKWRAPIPFSYDPDNDFMDVDETMDVPF